MRGIKFFAFVVGVVVALLFFINSSAAEELEYEYQETKDLVNLVQEAAVLIEEEGEAAFAEFNQKGSKWFHDDIYVMVFDLEGTRCVYPPHPDQVGQNILDLKDVNGKPIFQWFLETVNRPDKPYGWVHYQWPKPHASLPSWKSTFVMEAIAPSGKEYIVASGLYGLKMEKKFVQELVEDAVLLIESEKEAALPRLRDKSDKFIFGDTYVFVTSESGADLLNPAFPDVEGLPPELYEHASSKDAQKAIVDAVKDKEEAWVEYLWPKPGESKPSKKITYLKKIIINGKERIVGAGFYED